MFSGRVLKRDSARFAVLLLFSCFWGFVLRVFVAMLFVYLPVLVFVNFFHLRNNPVVLRRFRLSQYSLLFVYHLPVRNWQFQTIILWRCPSTQTTRNKRSLTTHFCLLLGDWHEACDTYSKNWFWKSEPEYQQWFVVCVSCRWGNIAKWSLTTGVECILASSFGIFVINCEFERHLLVSH